MKKTLGGDRLGAGKKIQVELHGYERSTHDPGYLWRSTMAAGTLVPFLCEVVLPGDTYDIDLDCDIKTHPTIGPLFGSYKVQLDIFQAPVRLYQGQLHNNKLGIGMEMSTVKLPQMVLRATNLADVEDIDNAQINPSCILNYLGIRGVGSIAASDPNPERQFNAVSLLAYWDIYKNYYANKQEEIGAVIHAEIVAVVATIDDIDFTNPTGTLPQAPTNGSILTEPGTQIAINYTGADPIPSQIKLRTSVGFLTVEEAFTNLVAGAGLISGDFNYTQYGTIYLINWDYIANTDINVGPPTVVTFPLENLDLMREFLLASVSQTTPVIINDDSISPFGLLLDPAGEFNAYMSSQEGLAIKTYQSDLFNNWLSTEWIDGTNGISEITAIDTSGGSFTIDTFILAKKVYNMLNRIAVSGGSYDDWKEVVYDHPQHNRTETPTYHGGLIKELVFQEVVSNSESSGTDTPTQPLGTLAGKGVLGKKHKGGKVTVKVDEPAYLMGIISLTPRIDYSQGNKWDTQLKTMDDFHKPALDEIGFQELITEQMHYATTTKASGIQPWVTKSAGKQPAWINYMTNVNVTKGNFAIRDNEMFMTLNRRYEIDQPSMEIQDLTTYIDPVKYNHIFAQTSLDAQNFWAQIAIDITARRKMSAKLMPNL